MSQVRGTIIAAHGRHYLAQAGDERWHCVTRGKRSDVAVGDGVALAPIAPGQGRIESIAERRTLLYRSDPFKSKLLAANVSQLFIVVATEPGFSDDLLSRALVASEAAGIDAHIVLNKTDICAALPNSRKRLQPYAAIGYPVHEVSARCAADSAYHTLFPLLQGQSTILIGQSGMGKSSLINLLVPGADAAVRDISTALGSGKHTTSFTRLYAFEPASSVIDSPGFQEFGLHQLSEGMLERAFPEFGPHLGRCKFYNCHHLTEPGCALLAAVESGLVAPARHALYVQLLHESSK